MLSAAVSSVYPRSPHTLSLDVYHGRHVGGVGQPMPARENKPVESAAVSQQRAEGACSAALGGRGGRGAGLGGGGGVGSASQLERSCRNPGRLRRRSLARRRCLADAWLTFCST